MSDIVKDVFNTTDKLNFLSSTKNITNLVSKFEGFANENETLEQRRERLCKMIITIRVLYVLTIFVALYYANSSGVIRTELFMGLSLLALAMPDIVLVVMIIMFIVNSGSNNAQEASGQQPPEYSATSSNESSTMKYALTQTPDIFN
jgi:ABC-type multidrug transport system fused ATPase/permease subunit